MTDERFVRTEQEVEKHMAGVDKLRGQLERERERRAEYAKRPEVKAREAKRRKALTADDPTEASIANAVDKDRLAKNANHVRHAQRIAELPPVEMSEPEEVRERVNWYFTLCLTDGIKPNLPGLALCFGLTRTGLMNAVADRRMPAQSAQELGRGIAMMDEILSAQTLEGGVNPVAAIYFMNNWLGYKNASEVTTRTEVADHGVDQKVLEQKYNTIAEIE